MKLQKITIKSIKDDLDKIIDYSQNGTAFCYHYFLKEKNVKELLAVYHEDKLVCLFPLFQKGKIIEQSTMYVPYGGPVFIFNDKNSYRKNFLLKREILNVLIDYLQLNYNEICFSCDTTIQDIIPFVKKKIIPEVRYTYKIDLRVGIDNIYSNFCNDRKKEIRKANKFGIKIVEDDTITKFDISKSLAWEKKYGNSSSEKFVKNYLKLSIEQNKGKVFVAEYNNIIIGGVAIVFDNNSAYIMYSYFDKDKDFGIIAKLYSEIIKYLKNNTTCNFLDFEGSVFESIEKWNLSFGSKQYIYFNFYWQKHNPSELFQDLYEYGEK